MPSYCAYVGCETKYKQPDVSFHKFPLHNSKLLKKWIEFVDRPGWLPTKWSSLCCHHFNKNDFRMGLFRSTLKKNAVPSIQTNKTNYDENVMVNEIPANIEQPILNSDTNGNNETIPINEEIHTNHDPSTNTEMFINNEIYENVELVDQLDIDVICRFCGYTYYDTSKLQNCLKNTNIIQLINKCCPSYLIYENDGLPKNICDICIRSLKKFADFLDNLNKVHQMLEEKFLNSHHIIDNFNEKETLMDNSHEFQNETINNKVKIKLEPITVIKQEILEPSQRFLPSELFTGQSLSNNDVIEITTPIDVIQVIEDCNIEEPDKIQFKNEIIRESMNEDEINENSSLQSELKIEKENFYQKNFEKSDEITIHQNSSNTVLNDHTYSKSLQQKSEIFMFNEEKTLNSQNFPMCQECNCYFELIEQLDHHLETFHSLSCQVCNECNSEFKTLYDYLMHKNNNHGTFLIDMTGEDDLNDKQNQIVTKKHEYITCKNCNQVLESKFALNHHQKYICVKTIFTCKFCGLQFNDRINRKTHILKNHSDCIKKQPQQKKSIGLRKKLKNKICIDSIIKGRYYCKFCSRSYNRYCNLLRHYRMHRPINQWNLKCGNCGMIFDKIYDLNRHCRSNCLPTNSLEYNKLNYICSICNKQLSSFKSLKIHEKVHSDQRPHVCETCGKKFHSPTNLYQHKKSHSNQKKFKCDLCNKLFKWKSALNIHMNSIHLNIKPFKCLICNKKFTRKADMLKCKHTVN